MDCYFLFYSTYVICTYFIYYVYYFLLTFYFPFLGGQRCLVYVAPFKSLNNSRNGCEQFCCPVAFLFLVDWIVFVLLVSVCMHWRLLYYRNKLYRIQQMQSITYSQFDSQWCTSGMLLLVMAYESLFEHEYTHFLRRFSLFFSSGLTFLYCFMFFFI